MNVNFTIKPFDELSPVDVYYILHARSQVFVVEQACVFQDIDELDFDSQHLVIHKSKSLVGYCRILPPDVIANDKSHPHIGRVLVLPEHRGKGLARQMMTRAIKYCHATYGKRPIQISAQTYLFDFYRSLGFEAISEPYLEDGLEHIDMLLPKPKSKLPSVKMSANLSAKNILINVLLLLLALMIIGVLYLLI
ncbi:GNAT family N-acetyltransferase [Psychrobacter sp. FDAARGOS_221]|uniref:GNAT family N-acetyltransferase n=1 Tax=Psychrobacter sp. FDAARGOS_221 TaxID=1975705 RepID=UPI000BB57152|nr:GNAT family N-acetyltransferase [Psychrobacter sp. FDAARGOS_221]PNK59643.1 GNAT family N-acetyltransferase [Psychrobacter sp. FDAARGOS_221]